MNDESQKENNMKSTEQDQPVVWGTPVNGGTFEDAVKEGWTGTEEDWGYLSKAVKSIFSQDMVGYVEPIDAPLVPLKESHPELYNEQGEIDVKGLIEKGKELCVIEKMQATAPGLVDDKGSVDLVGLCNKGHRITEIFNEADLGRGLTEEATRQLDVKNNPELYQAASNLPHQDGGHLREIDTETIEMHMKNNMTLIYPCHYSSQEVELLLKFFRALEPTLGEPVRIYTYHAMVDNIEIVWFRFEHETGSKTFGLMSKHKVEFLACIEQDPMMSWIMQANGHPGLAKKNMLMNVFRAPIEFPIEWFLQKPDYTHPMDRLLTEDFTNFDNIMDALRIKVSTYVGEIIRKSKAFVNSQHLKDHELYLTFKATPDFQHLVVGLQKVYPKVPEGGVSLGDNLTTTEEWAEVSKRLEVSHKNILNAGKHINRAIDKARNQIALNAHLQDMFSSYIRELMMSASHFIEMVYGFDINLANETVHEALNDILERLHRYEQSDERADRRDARIGLDLNSWYVWEYVYGQIPTRVTAPEVQFHTLLPEMYVPSFIQALYTAALASGQPMFKPYEYREVADLSDGHAIGSVRVVK